MTELLATLLTRLSKLEANPALVNKIQSNQTFYALTEQSAFEFFESFDTENYETAVYICRTEAVLKRMGRLRKYLKEN